MKRFFLFAILLTAILSLKANDGVFFANGNHLVPITETDVRVQKEILTIKRVNDHLEVTVYYEFFNPTKEKKLLVGFEAESPYPTMEEDFSFLPEHSHIRNFTVMMNGQSLPYKIAHVPELREDQTARDAYRDGQFKTIDKQAWLDSLEEHPYEVDFVYYFNAFFKKGLNIIQHTYEYDLSYGVGIEYEFLYVLTAANRWANNGIDDFTLNIDMGERQSFQMECSFFKNPNEWTIHGVGKCVQKGKRWTDNEVAMFHIQDGHISWQKKNFHPEGELNLFQYDFYMFSDIYMFSQPEKEWGVEDLFSNQYFKLDTNQIFTVQNLPYQDETTGLSSDKRRILRNLPFAYRGYVFQNNKLRQYFESCEWYIPNPSYEAKLEELSEPEQRWVEHWGK